MLKTLLIDTQYDGGSEQRFRIVWKIVKIVSKEVKFSWTTPFKAWYTILGMISRRLFTRQGDVQFCRILQNFGDEESEVDLIKLNLELYVI